MMIEFGAEIEVNGVRPAWLADDVIYQWRDPSNRNLGPWVEGSVSTVFGPYCGNATDIITHIRLPADHFAYKAIERGFEPWGGGNRAPTDWDGGEILLKNGCRYFNAMSMRWTHDDSQTGSNIIGYRKKAAAQPVAEHLETNTPVAVSGRFGGTVYKEALGRVIRRNARTTNYSIELHNGYRLYDVPRYAINVASEIEAAPPTDTITIARMTEVEVAALPALMGAHPASMVGSRVVCVLRDLGIIRDETPVERFARITGIEVTDANRVAVEAALGFRD